jgi:flagellar basal-body rod protein FlgB
MDPTRIPILDLAEQRLGWIDRRQELLAHNIANIDTPGWQPRDLPPFASKLADIMTPGLAQTAPGHLAGTDDGAAGSVGKPRPSGRAPNGNAVTLDSQLTKVAETATTQDLVTTIYKKYLGLFSLALGRGQ